VLLRQYRLTVEGVCAGSEGISEDWLMVSDEGRVLVVIVLRVLLMVLLLLFEERAVFTIVSNVWERGTTNRAVLMWPLLVMESLRVVWLGQVCMRPAIGAPVRRFSGLVHIELVRILMVWGERRFVV
jgi:hypothetical protein